ncbi:hypothetical protein CHUAL_007449 [Chamberlinius hualienensis]
MVYDSLYGFCKIGRFFGLFATSNIGHCRSAKDLKCSWNWTVIIYIVFSLSQCGYFIFTLTFNSSELEAENHNAISTFGVQLGNVLTGLQVLVQFNWHSSCFVSFIKKWSTFQLPNVELQNFLKYRWLILVILNLSFGVLTSSTAALFLKRSQSQSPVYYWLIIRSFVPNIAYFNVVYVIIFVNYFIFCSRLSYISNLSQLSHILKSFLKGEKINTKLEEIRQRHQDIYDISSKLSRLISPMLFIVIINQGADICFTLGKIANFSNSGEGCFRLYLLIGHTVVRILPLWIVCDMTDAAHEECEQQQWHCTTYIKQHAMSAISKKNNNVVYENFIKVFFIGRLLGLFPNTTTGSLNYRKNFNFAWRKSWNFGVTTMIFVIVAQVIQFLWTMYMLDSTITNNLISTIGIELSNMICGLMISIHFLIYSLRIFKFLFRWNQGYEYQTKLRSFGKFLFVSFLTLIICFISCCYFHAEDYGYRQMGNAIDQVYQALNPLFAAVTYTNQVFLMVFMTYYAHVIELSHRFNYSELLQELSNQFLNGYQNILKLRFKHQYHCRKMQQLSQLFSPVLLYTIVNQGIDICLSFEKIGHIVKYNEGLWRLLVLVGFAIVRIYPLGLMCYSAQKAYDESKKGLTLIHSAKLCNLDPETRFQIYLYEMTVQSCDSRLTASGIAVVNRQLFVQLAGLITTYLVILLEFNK